MAEAREGGCQCGRVRYRLSGEPVRVAACFCAECRRQSGSAFGISMMVREADFTLLQGTLKRFTRVADSGRTVDCAFCPDCGVRIFHVPDYGIPLINVKPGTLDDVSGVHPTVEAFAAQKPDWLQIAGIEESHPGQP